MLPKIVCGTNGSPADLMIVTSPGIENLTAAECRCLGYPSLDASPGAVRLQRVSDQLPALNLSLRTATRVLLGLGEFHAGTFYQFEERFAKLPWQAYLPPGRLVRLRVTSKQSRLYHGRAVATRAAAILEGAVHDVKVIGPGNEDGEAGDHQLIIIRLLHDRCTVRLDTSGAPLYQRGYRTEAGIAPLRETLAAALLLAAGWDGATPLLDPLAGSGTIPIEAALLARRIAPGLLRTSFAAEAWPCAERGEWKAARAEARSRILPSAPVRIAGGDRDAKVLAIAEANAARAGVAEGIRWEVRPMSGWRSDESLAGALVACNPPYGVRLEADRGGKGFRSLYAGLGELVRGHHGRFAALVPAAERLDAMMGLSLNSLFVTSNGGIRVRGVGRRE